MVWSQLFCFDHVWSPCQYFSNHTMIVDIVILGETWWNHQSHSLCCSDIEHQTSILLVMEIPWTNPYVWIPWKQSWKTWSCLPNLMFTYVLPCFTWKRKSMLFQLVFPPEKSYFSPFFSHWFQAEAGTGETLFCLAATKVASAAERGNHRGPPTFTWKTQLPWYHGLWKSLNNSKIHQSLIRYISYHIFSLRYQIRIFFLGKKRSNTERILQHTMFKHTILDLRCCPPSSWFASSFFTCIHYYKIQ